MDERIHSLARHLRGVISRPSQPVHGEAYLGGQLGLDAGGGEAGAVFGGYERKHVGKKALGFCGLERGQSGGYGLERGFGLGWISHYVV